VRTLLETHAMYWYIEGDRQLSSQAQKLIQDVANEVLVSPASYWEIAIKLSIGKWKLNRSYEEFVDIALNTYGFRMLPILPTHTARLIGLPFHHRDPFDRMLVAQALVENTAIISNDAALDAYGITRLW